MKTVLSYRNVLSVLLALTFFACQSKKDGSESTNTQQQTPQFSTSSEAVKQGKKDLLELLRTNPANGMNLNLQLLEKAQPEESITAVDIDFQQFLKADSLQSFRSLITVERGKITPLYADGQMVTSINTRIDNGSWSVSGIKDLVIESELSEMRNNIQEYRNAEIIFFEIPNIDAHVFSVNNNGQEAYYSNYNGMSLSKALAPNELLQILKNEALAFEREYGDQLKKGKLTK